MSSAAHKLAPLFSSASTEHETPQDLFDELDAEWRFDVDVCATAENAKCVRYFSALPEPGAWLTDGLHQRWEGSCFCNPPYGREIDKWVAKACAEARGGHAATVMLLPSRTDTRWWHEYVIPFGETRFLRGRLKFGSAKNSAPFPSAVVVFRRQMGGGA